MTFHPEFSEKTVWLTNLAITAAISAGIKINEVYSSADFKIRIKDDNTPVTIADQMAHAEITDKLLASGLPVLSEEGIHLSYNERKDWELFWLVDPLDGTKEFIKRNDEFTVNIALIERNKPISGVIYAPVSGELYAGIPEIGAYKIDHPKLDCTFNEMQLSGIKLPLKTAPEKLIVAVSRSHMNQQTANYIDQISSVSSQTEIQQKGSSLKICMVAEGTANVYPKFGKTMEWDTAAGHAIIRASGKNIICPETNAELIYNKKDLQNPNFIAK
jgi:3'(2'), 5'-bisphosphate nucleotidase